MGSISIGLKRKPVGKIAVFEWDEGNMAFVAVDLQDETTTIQSPEEFCEKYTDKKLAELELKIYQDGGFKYVLDTRRFNYGKTRHEAKNKHY